MKILIAILLYLSSNVLITADACSVFDEIFQNSKIRSYLHANVAGRSTLYLVENKFCPVNKQFGSLTVATVNEKDAVAHKNYVKITSVKNTPKGKTIYLNYPIEGACFVIKCNTTGKIISVDINEL